MDFGDAREGADVLAVLLRCRKYLGDLFGELFFGRLLHGGHQFNGLGQRLMPFGKFFEPFIDGHAA